MVRYLAMLMFCIYGCSEGARFVIRGQLQGAQYDGEKIYMVPIENASLHRIDSTVIKNGQFWFDGVADTIEIYVLRARPLLRLQLQELLVVKEPGDIQVTLSENSVASGTSLNDSLQMWKREKMQLDSLYYSYYNKIRHSNDSVKSLLMDSLTSLQNRSVAYHFGFVKHNGDNVVGQLVQKMMEGAFTQDQRNELSH
ncbi:uncharacterized protein DUF4369 [Breznakibacter xylanolyticus]|uniref:Uncharacterized protein DUF4369 n=1 Tax=Breznakibacter xylanolyticus TaxID=990 RepID=A0A2W7P043_9BACT|nr:DUF4369 domain-containing protein [Breznakibacter xylanolyticus]PZX16822.1 uncharacterized protein DUF4369 [Breznakibacter xylanolyticus]